MSTLNEVKFFLEIEGIKLPEDFEERLRENRNRGGMLPPIIAFEAVMKMSQVWKPYLIDSNEFSKLVCHGVYSMARIHCCVLRSYRIEGSINKAYIGDICRIKQGKLPPGLSTTANEVGGTFIKKI